MHCQLSHAGPSPSKISGKQHSSKISHLDVNDTEITDTHGIANALAQTFSDNSSLEQYTTNFQSFRRQAEKQPLNFKSCGLETYNKLFSMDKLTSAVSKSHDTAVGPDDIHYQMLNTFQLQQRRSSYKSLITFGAVVIFHQVGIHLLSYPF